MATEITRDGILGFIDDSIDLHKQTPSQWQTDQEFKKYTKEHRITVKHIEENSGLTIDEGVYPFNQDRGKIYQAPDSTGTLSYVKASCNGTKIKETLDGQDTEKEFYKLEGTDLLSISKEILRKLNLIFFTNIGSESIIEMGHIMGIVRTSLLLRLLALDT